MKLKQLLIATAASLLVAGVVVAQPYGMGAEIMGGGYGPGVDRALSILKERYARGEIDKAEFDARKRDLA